METVYSMIIDRMQENEGIGLYSIISTLALQGLIEVEVVERVWKERNDTLGNITLRKYLTNNGMSVTPRQWILDWLKLMHEEEVKRLQSKEKEMSDVSPYLKMAEMIENGSYKYMCDALDKLRRVQEISDDVAKLIAEQIKRELRGHNSVEGMLREARGPGYWNYESAKDCRIKWLKKMHKWWLESNNVPKETVWSLLYDSINSGKKSFICNALASLARDGEITEVDGEKVSKAIKQELGEARTVEEMLGVVYPHAKGRAWRLDWLKKMHEKTLEEMQQPKKVEHMKTLNFKEAMYALADGKAVYRIDGTQAEGFNEDCIYATGEHPHAEVIRAFAEGKKIEFNNGEGDTWTATSWPSFTVGYKYRVKSEYDLREGNTILKPDGSMWTITTGAKLYAMSGLGRIDDGFVVFSQDTKNFTGLSWDLLEECVRDGEIQGVLVAAKNRK